MKCNTVNKIVFSARLTTAPRPRKDGIKLKTYLQEGIEQFELQTQNKPGCMTLRSVDRFEYNNPDSLFYFWGNQLKKKNSSRKVILFEKNADFYRFLKENNIEEAKKHLNYCLEYADNYFPARKLLKELN